MKSLWRYLAAGIAAYGVFLLLSAPAARLLPYLLPPTQAVRLSGVSGTLWSGRAVQLTAGAVTVTDVTWRLRPLHLLLGSVEYGVNAQLGDQPLTARVGRGLFAGPYVSDLTAQLAAADVLYRAGLRQLGVDGRLSVDIDTIKGLAAGRLPAMAGTLKWAPARVLAPLVLDLGEVQLATQIVSGATQGRLTAAGGALTLDGELTINADGNYRLVGEVRKRAGVPQAVDRFLETFAEFKNGSYHLEWSDQIKIP